MGFLKIGVIDGYATDRGIEYLESHCTSEGIRELFLKVAESTGNAAYLPTTGQRDITVSLGPTGEPRPTIALMVKKPAAPSREHLNCLSHRTLHLRMKWL